ncbi:NTP transferase domain-containing protein [Candidatus Uhrbacteria bacterium]|nr:NTP transferase domain-containing protein [Candidatus Uhrbacteria bacterium]
MQAVILAAGEGMRLRPLTDDRPKPMVLIGGKPILEYTLNMLPKEIEEVILVVGYKQEKIKEYFGNEWSGKHIVYVDQSRQKGTGDALVKAQPFLNGEPFLLLQADDLYHPDDLSALAASDLPAVLVIEHEHPERFGVCTVSPDGLLLELIEKPAHPKGNLVNVGPNLLHHDIFDLDLGAPMLPNGESNLAAQIGIWLSRRPVRAMKGRFWYAIGYPQDLEGAERYVNLFSRKTV